MNKVFFIALASLFISLLSPFLGYIFLVSIGGSKILLKEKTRVTSFTIISIGIIILYILGLITVLEVSDIIGSVLLTSWIFIMTLIRTKDYTKALYYGCLSQIAYAIFRTILFSDIYQQRIETLFEGYESILGSGITAFSSGNGQLEMILTQIKSILLDYQMAIWGITMIFAVYIATLFLAKRSDYKWQHHLFRFPHSLIYLFILALGLAVIPYTRIFGLNSVLIIVIVFLLQGLAIVEYWCKKHLKNSRFVMLAIIILMFVNIFFALLVSLLGLIDNWLDIRKINHI